MPAKRRLAEGRVLATADGSERTAFGQIAAIPPVAGVQTQRKSRALGKLSVTPRATPLGGRVPTGPIFIPAELILQKQSQSREESVMERGASGPPAIVPLRLNYSPASYPDVIVGNSR
jgi:hypothetical protein